MSTKLFSCLVLLAMVEPAVSADAGQAAARQEMVQADTRELLGRLERLLDEYNRNRLADGDDFAAVGKLHGTLQNLTDEEMASAIAILKQAEAARDPAQARERTSEAYPIAQDVARKLKELLAQYRRAQEVQSLADSLARLADRQAANLTVAEEMASPGNQGKPAAAPAGPIEAQQAEQTAIAAEVKQMAEKFAALGNDPTATAAAAGLNEVAPKAEAAAQALAARDVAGAASAEKDARDRLQQIAQSMVTPAANARAQDAAGAGIGRVLKEQQDLAAQTGRLNRELGDAVNKQSEEQVEKAVQAELNKKGSALAAQLANEGLSAGSPLEQLQSSPEVQKFIEARAAQMKQTEAGLRQQLSTLAPTQANLAAEAQGIFQKLPAHSALQAPMNAAFAQMQSARNALAAPDGENALKAQNAAAGQLTAAQKLAQQNGVPAATSPPARAPAAVATERQTASIGGLIQKQLQLEMETSRGGKTPAPRAAQALAARQAAIQKATGDVRKSLAQPEPAQALTDAEKAMATAGEKLASAAVDPAAARAAQQQATNALYQAAEAQAESAAAAARPPAGAAANVASQLAKADATVAAAQLAMSRAAGQTGTPSANLMRNAANQLGQALAPAWRAMDSPGASPQTIQAAAQAQEALSAAAAEAAALNPQTAQAMAGQARQALAAAQSVLAQAQSGIQAASGESASSQTEPSAQTTGPGVGAKEKQWRDKAGAVSPGAAGARGPDRFAGLPAREREALEQSQAEKYPQEYGAMVEQYMRGLAEDAASTPK